MNVVSADGDPRQRRDYNRQRMKESKDEGIQGRSPERIMQQELLAGRIHKRVGTGDRRL